METPTKLDTLAALDSEAHVRVEREKGRELRRSRWWQNLVARTSCHYCGKALTKATATMDHIVPLAQGGRSTPGNVVPACRQCNTRKKDLTAAELALEATPRA
jgi:5-methylcytosine-specific restriction endonuclease McrA